MKIHKLSNEQTDAYFKMVSDLQGYRVVDVRSKRIIPKYILFERVGQSVGQEYNMIVEMSHSGYMFIKAGAYKLRSFRVLD